MQQQFQIVVPIGALIGATIIKECIQIKITKQKSTTKEQDKKGKFDTAMLQKLTKSCI